MRPGIDLMPAVPVLGHRLLHSGPLHHAPPFSKANNPNGASPGTEQSLQAYISGRGGQPAAIQSTTRSPIMITVAWAPPDLGMRGITDASATHNPCTPLTLQYWSTTAIGSVSGPILQVPETCLAGPTVWRIQRSNASSLARMSVAGWIRWSATSLYASDSS